MKNLWDDEVHLRKVFLSHDINEDQKVDDFACMLVLSKYNGLNCIKYHVFVFVYARRHKIDDSLEALVKLLDVLRIRV